MTDPRHLGAAVLRLRYTRDVPAEQDKYYRLNLASSWLCNRCHPRDRERMLAEIENLVAEAQVSQVDILEVYADMLCGAVHNWITVTYAPLFVGAMELLTQTRPELEKQMHPTERAHAHQVALDIYRAVLEELYNHEPQTTHPREEG